MLNSFIAIIAALISVFIGIFFLYYLIREICHFFELKKIQRLNNNKYINTTPQQLYEQIYLTEYVNQITLGENIQTAYQEYNHQQSLLQSKISFFYTMQTIFGTFFTFIFKTFVIHNNVLAFIPICFGVATFILFSNIENSNNKIANIRFYILRMEQLINQPLMNFFDNGFYKQNFDSDRNVLILFIPFIIISWILLGVCLLFYRDEYIEVIFIIAAVVLFMIMVNWQYNAHKSYGFNNDTEKK